MPRESTPIGTHQQRTRPEGGYPNTCAPTVREGRAVRRARKNLAARIKSYAGSKQSAGVRKPGSMKVK